MWNVDTSLCLQLDSGAVLQYIMNFHNNKRFDEEWQKLNVDLNALQEIVLTHFRSKSSHHECLDEGSYARIYLFTLENDKKIIARVLLPIRESVKTEAEVTAMVMVRTRTKLPVPKVYLYCSTRDNPVGTEWILMEYMRGERLEECMESLKSRQLQQLGTDLANVMASLFNIKASQCGSVLPNLRLSSYEGLRYHALRYPVSGKRPLLCSSRLNGSTILDGQLIIGPVNDITFLDYSRQIPPDRCCPFDSERKWMEGFAFLGNPPTREDSELERGPFEKALEVYDVVRGLYDRRWEHTEQISSHETFHFAHGDLSPASILIDRGRGKITGIIDWEMAGFRPAWLAAVAGGWFDDDSDRFIMTEHQEGRENYANEGPEDAGVRSQFRVELAALDMTLFRHHFQGLELRALFYACCNEIRGNTQSYLQVYHDHEWSVHRRGKFPFDFWAWYWEREDLWQRTRTVMVTPVAGNPL